MAKEKRVTIKELDEEIEDRKERFMVGREEAEGVRIYDRFGNLKYPKPSKDSKS